MKFKTQIESQVATGTAPFSVASNTVVVNLNAELLNGNNSAAFASASHNHATLYQPLNSTLNAVAAGTYSGDDSITTVGIIATGTWNATTITVARGGTGSTTAAGARTNLEAPKVFISATEPTPTNTGDIWFIP